MDTEPLHEYALEPHTATAEMEKTSDDLIREIHAMVTEVYGGAMAAINAISTQVLPFLESLKGTDGKIDIKKITSTLFSGMGF